MQPDGNYIYWGCREFWINAWKVFRGTAGSGFEPAYSCGRYDDYLNNFDETTGTKLNPIDGDIQFISTSNKFVKYNGTSWIDVNQTDFTWNFNYGKYLTMWNLTPPTICVEFLGVNDWRGSEPDGLSFTTWNQKMETMIASYKTAVPTGKFVILLPVSSMGLLDNSAGDYTDKQSAAMWEGRKNLIDVFDGRESENIYVVDAGIAVDNKYGYTKDTTSVSIPFNGYTGSDSIFLQNGNPHPYPNYPSMGISLAAFIQKFR